MDKQELTNILAEHSKWLVDKTTGKRANLLNANLENANLEGANLRNGVIGNSKEIKTLQCAEYHVVITKDIMAIGCEQHSITDWFNFSDADIAKMDADALSWCKIWKPALQTTINTFINNN